jgi:hypothetical protein
MLSVWDITEVKLTSEIFTPVTIIVLRDVTPCTLVNRYRHIERICCIHFLGMKLHRNVGSDVADYTVSSQNTETFK